MVGSERLFEALASGLEDRERREVGDRRTLASQNSLSPIIGSRMSRSSAT